MPRVTVAHEQAVRQRIVEAAIRVFGEMDYQRATVQDVVRASGLSVGAVYTYFKSKEELFLVRSPSCGFVWPSSARSRTGSGSGSTSP